MSDRLNSIGQIDKLMYRGPRPLKLTMPMPPNRSNARWHWRTENKLKGEYYDLCLVSVRVRRPSLVPKHTRITVRMFTWSPMDADNLMARLKWPVDWLVIRGYIRDDSPDALTWEMPTQAIDRKNQRIEVELQEITHYDDAA